MKKVCSIALMLLLLCSFSVDPTQQEYHYQGYTQGTYYSIIYFANHEIVSSKEIESLLADFMLTASLWEKNSVIAKINRNEDVVLDSNFMAIFKKAQEISQITDGNFDITVGNLVNAWGIGYKEKVNLPKSKIDSLLRFVDYRNIGIDGEKIQKKYPEIMIDFNAIAKGYSVDLVSDYLKRRGINNFIVDIGGEIRTSGVKANGNDWLVGIERPSEDAKADRKIQYAIRLRDKSMATSGTYRKYREENGIRYSHTIDPKTGYPVSHTLLSATVIADDCMTADALATAFMVMGVEKAKLFLNSYKNCDALFIYTDEKGEFQILYTKGFVNLFYTE